MPTAPMAGHDIWVETRGIGPPAVMIHCLLGQHAAMVPLAQQLGHSTTLFDMPGHGRSKDWDGTTDYQTVCTAIVAALCDGPTHLIGHSFGATVALRLAVEQPDLVNRLTLIEPVYFAAAKGTPAHAAHAKIFRPFIAAMLAGDELRAAQIFNMLWGDRPWGDMSARRQAYLTERIRLVVATGAEVEADPSGITSATRLAGLHIPVTLIRGAGSPDIIGAVHDVLTSRIAGATDRVVPDAGHMVPLTHPDQVAAIIRAADQEIG